MVQTSILIILGLTLSGYLFLSNCLVSKFKISRVQGHHLVYQVLFWGVIFHLLAAVIFAMCWSATSDSSWLFSWVARVIPGLDQALFNTIAIMFIALSAAFVSQALINRSLYCRCVVTKIQSAFSTDEEGKAPLSRPLAWRILLLGLFKNPTKTLIREKWSEARSDCELKYYLKSTDSRLITHFINEKPHVLMADGKGRDRLLLITLASRKAYVCIPTVIKAPVNASDHEEVGILPVYSGYRDKDDLCLEITTRYPFANYIRAPDLTLKAVKDTMAAEPTSPAIDMAGLADFEITLKLTDVVSIAYFNPGMYRSFKIYENERHKMISDGRSVNVKGRFKTLMDRFKPYKTGG